MCSSSVGGNYTFELNSIVIFFYSSTSWNCICLKLKKFLLKELPFKIYLELYLSVRKRACLARCSRFARSFHMQLGFWSCSFLKFILLLSNPLSFVARVLKRETSCMARAIRKKTYCGVRRSLRERGTVKSTSLDLFMLAKKSLKTRQDALSSTHCNTGFSDW